MRGVLETLVTDFVIKALGPGLAVLLMAAPPRKAGRAQLKKIYVLNEMGDMDGEYVLDPDCPIDYNDFLKVLPDDGIGDREALFVGEYVFTAFQSGKWVFVLLSRGQLGPEDMSWTATLLTAADAHLAAEAKAGGSRPPEPAKPTPDLESAVSKRQSELDAREKELAKLEVQLKADQANLNGRDEELARQKERLVALADYVNQMQQNVVTGVDRAQKSLVKTEEMAATAATAHQDLVDAKAVAELKSRFDNERKGLLQARDDLEAKYREASERVRVLETQAHQAAEALAKERAETAAREAEAERMRVAIESRVQELSGRFAAMAKERLMTSHKPSTGPGAAGELPASMETEKAELAKERKFLQRRAVEMLDREEKLRGRETALGEKEAALAKREAALAAPPRPIEEAKPGAPPSPTTTVEAEEARKDIEMRVKIIQQKALELLDREEKLRKRAAELQALEARLAGTAPAR